MPFINTEQEKENKKIGRIYFTEQQISLKMSSKDLSRKTFSEIRSCICNLLTIAIPLYENLKLKVFDINEYLHAIKS